MLTYLDDVRVLASMRPAWVLLASALVLTGCGTTMEEPDVPAPLGGARGGIAAPELRTFQAGEAPRISRPFSEVMPSLPPPVQQGTRPVAEPGIGPAPDARVSSLNFAQVPVGEFVRTVYAEILKRTVVVDDAVQSSRDLITIRTPTDLSPQEIERVARELLADYGIAVRDEGGVIKVSADPTAATALPVIQRGGASADMPPGLRQVFQLVTLQAVRNTDVASWIRTMFGDRVQLTEDPGRNAVMLSGAPDAVASALDAIRMLDQPVMAGRASLRINPTYWSAQDLVEDLSEVLAAEGYTMPPANASPRTGIRYPVILIPVDKINAVLVFASSNEVLEHVRNWAYRLDVQNTSTQEGSELVQYKVRNTTAEQLGRFLEALLSDTPPQSSGSVDADADAGTTANADVRGVAGTSSVVVDTDTNSLTFRVNADDRDAILALLRSVDQPALSTLLDVTIAEISLDRENELGVEWLLREAAIATGTGSSAVIGASGLALSWLNNAGDLRLAVNALATSNDASVLSTPSIMARNGEEAEIQVGQEVPIITSQQTSLAGATTENSTGVLQTIQYRDTGVILRVRPIIHSGDMVDLEVEQEVSSAQRTLTGVDASPTFSTRRMKTKLTLRHGETVLLGGLISSDVTRSESGVPGLKDVPYLGTLFRRNVDRQRRTELIMLITPYILADRQEFDSVLESFKQRMSLWKEMRKEYPQTSNR